MKTWNQTPLLKCALALVVGILLQRFNAQAALPVILLGGMAWLAGYLLGKRASRIWDLLSSGGVWLVFLGLGMGLRTMELRVSEPSWNQSSEFKGWMEGVVANSPKKSPFGWSMQVDVTASYDSTGWQHQQARVMVYLPKGEAPAQFEKVRIWGKIEPVKSKSEGFVAYLKSQGISLQVKGKQFEVVGKTAGWKPLAKSVQQTFALQLGTLMADTAQLGVAKAMLLGDRAQLSRDMSGDYASAGLSHVLAISGMHIGVVFIMLTYALSFMMFFKGGRVLQSLLILGLLLSYMLITGASPAVVRAVVMFGSVLIVRIFHKRHNMLNVLAIPALIQLVIQPSVLFMPGFQLSYAAVMGILLFMPWFQKLFFSGNFWWDMFAGWIGVSLSASIFTAPLVWMHFGRFPAHFLLSNILCSILVTLIVFAGFILVLISWVPVVNELLAQVLGGLINALNIIAHEIATLPAAVITRWSIDEPACRMLLMELVVLLLVLGIPALIKNRRNQLDQSEPQPRTIWA